VSDEPDKSCPCCSGKELDEIGKLPDSRWFANSRLDQPLAGGTLCRCRTCKLKFRNPAYSAARYAQLYDNATTSNWSPDMTRLDWNLIHQYVAKTLPQGGRVLDFGCYTGGLLAQLGTQYQRHGIELNRDAADVAAQIIGSEVWSSVDEIPDGLRFDVIIAADVIEHVTNPMSLVRELSSKLSDKGVLLITTGDADNYLWNRFGANWWYCFYPEHIVFVSADWIQYVSEAAGVSVVDCETFCYFDLSRTRRILDLVQVHVYGAFPTAYLGLVRLLRSMLGRPDSQSIPGAGTSRDHLFVVLSGAARN
jgi:SAM-dependent methyltransferase